jgi:hypothetical protein
MGFLSWIKGNRTKSPRPPWVRPEFLGVFALLLVGAMGVGYWSLGEAGQGSQPVSATTRHEYVGIEPAELGSQLPCDPGCYADWLFDAWVRDHPDAEVLGKTPRQFQGVLIGYDIEYRPA